MREVGDVAARLAPVEEAGRPASSMPSVTLSATVKTGTSMKCWCTMPMPAAIASRGEPNLAGSPSIRISPSSGWVSP